MPAINIIHFGGERPKIAPDLLAAHEATIARNCRLDTGDLRSLPRPKKVVALEGTSIKTIYRWDANSTSYWCESANDLDFARSPIAGEAYERVYYTGESEARVLANDLVSTPFDFTTDFYKLGVPAPTAAPTVATTGGGAGYKGYVYTFVTSYGEEGPPSPVGTDDDYDSGVVTIRDIENAPAGRAITLVRVYRTSASGSGVATFRYVCEASWFSATEAYAVGDFVVYDGDLWKCTTIHPAGAWNAGHFTEGDDVADADLLEVIPSVDWDPPPAGLKGLIALPSSGVFAGFLGNKVYLSEPGLPHAWPTTYIQAFHHDVVGLGFFGSNIVVITEGYPSILYGSEPATMSRFHFADFAPGVAKRGIAMGGDGVFFPTTVGLGRIDANGFTVVTDLLLNPRDWDDMTPTSMLGVYHEGKYIGFYNGAGGFVLDFTNKAYSPLGIYAHAAHVSLGDGKLYVAVTDEDLVDEDDPPASLPLCVSEWAGDPVNFLVYTWRKRYSLRRANLSSALVVLDQEFFDSIDAQTELETLNAALFATDLEGAFNTCAFNRHAWNGDTLLSLDALSMSADVVFRLYVDDDLKFERTLTDSQNVFRLPSGFRGRHFDVELTGFAPVRRVALAPSMRELDQ